MRRRQPSEAPGRGRSRVQGVAGRACRFGVRLSRESYPKGDLVGRRGARAKQSGRKKLGGLAHGLVSVQEPLHPRPPH